MDHAQFPQGSGSQAPLWGYAGPTLIEETFEAFTRRGYSEVDFFAPWCGPCRQLAPIFGSAAPRHAGRANFGRLVGATGPKDLERCPRQHSPAPRRFATRRCYGKRR